VKRVLPFVIFALVIPGVALAKSNPNKGTHPNHGKAKVQYILKGQLSGFTAFDSSTSTNGSITIAVTHSNRHGRVLKGLPPLTFTGMVTSSTKVVLGDGVTLITDNDLGVVKVRAPKQPKTVSGTDLAALLTGMPVRQIIDQGPSS
jgi:hypothetical protein